MKKTITILFLTLVAVTCVSAQSDIDSKNRCLPDSSLSNIEVHLEVPEFIESGLTDGSMERIGGVIRHTEDQQTIAWLRQGGQIGQVAESAGGLLEQVTKLSGQGQMALGSLVASVMPFLNISMAGFSLIEQIAGIRAHEAELERIYDRVSEEFQRDRRVELSAALETAENSLLLNSREYKLAVVAEVNSDLAVARKQLIEELSILLSAEISPEHIELAVNYQALSMKVCALETRLRLDVGETVAAIDLLSQCVSEHETSARDFVSEWLGDNPAKYFHKSVEAEHLESYLDIARWLRGERDVLRDLIMQHRQDFWDNSAIDELYTGGVRPQLKDDPLYKVALPNAEFLIENVQRLQGYELDLDSMCFSNFAAWEAYDGDGNVSIDNHDGYVLLVRKPPPRDPSDP